MYYTVVPRPTPLLSKPEVMRLETWDAYLATELVPHNLEVFVEEQ